MKDMSTETCILITLGGWGQTKLEHSNGQQHHSNYHIFPNAEAINHLWSYGYHQEHNHDCHWKQRKPLSKAPYPKTCWRYRFRKNHIGIHAAPNNPMTISPQQTGYRK
jgi:hypothetical protein